MRRTGQCWRWWPVRWLFCCGAVGVRCGVCRVALDLISQAPQPLLHAVEVAVPALARNGVAHPVMGVIDCKINS